MACAAGGAVEGVVVHGRRGSADVGVAGDCLIVKERGQLFAADVELFERAVVVEMRGDGGVERELDAEVRRELPDSFEISGILGHQHAGDDDSYALSAQAGDGSQRALERSAYLCDTVVN